MGTPVKRACIYAWMASACCLEKPGWLPKASSSFAASIEAGEEPNSLKSAWSEFSSRT